MSVVVFVLVSVCHIVFRLLIVDFVEYSIKSFKNKNKNVIPNKECIILTHNLLINLFINLLFVLILCTPYSE